MSNSREDREQEARAESTSLAQATASGGMIAVVAVILLASWILKVDPHRGEPSRSKTGSASTAAVSPGIDGTPWNMAPLTRGGGDDSTSVPASAPAGEPRSTDAIAKPQAIAPVHEVPAPPVPAPVAASPTSPMPDRQLSTLQVRAVQDAQRLAAHRGAWAAQVAAVCNEDRVAEHLRKVAGSDRFYIVPVTIKDRSCYRLLWGTYDTAAAAAAADLPPSLKSADKPRVVAVRELVP